MGRIGDMQSLFGLTARAIRYYEQLGLIESERSGRNMRLYSARARDRLRWIADLRTAGVPLTGIQEVIEMDRRGADRVAQMPVALTKLSELSDQLRAELATVERVSQKLEAELMASRGPAAPTTLVAREPVGPRVRRFA